MNNDLIIDLDMVRTAARNTLDTAVASLREKFVTPMAGQEMIYMAKADEAAAFASDNDPIAGNYPLLSAEVGITAPTLADVAAIVAGKAVAWKQIAAAIETVRLRGNKAIDAASTEEELDQALWPAIETLNAIAAKAGVS